MLGARMSHRKWRVTKQHPSRTSSGHQISCCLFSLHFLCAILATITVQLGRHINVPKIQMYLTLPCFDPLYDTESIYCRRGGKDAPNIWHFVLLLLLASSLSSLPASRTPLHASTYTWKGYDAFSAVVFQLPGVYGAFTGLSDDNDIFLFLCVNDGSRIQKVNSPHDIGHGNR